MDGRYSEVVDRRDRYDTLSRRIRITWNILQSETPSSAKEPAELFLVYDPNQDLFTPQVEISSLPVNDTTAIPQNYS